MLEGGQTYDAIYRAHGTGSLGGVAFDPMIGHVRLIVKSRKGS